MKFTVLGYKKRVPGCKPSRSVLRSPKHDGLRPLRRRNSLLCVCVCLTAYFGYHTIQGRHGLEAHSRLIERSKVLEQEIRALEVVQVRLVREVGLLNETRPDADFIDEIARDMLGFAHPNDRLIIERRRSANVLGR